MRNNVSSETKRLFDKSVENLKNYCDKVEVKENQTMIEIYVNDKLITSDVNNDIGCWCLLHTIEAIINFQEIK